MAVGLALDGEGSVGNVLAAEDAREERGGGLGDSGDEVEFLEGGLACAPATAGGAGARGVAAPGEGEEVDPLCGNYREWKLCGMPPSSAVAT